MSGTQRTFLFFFLNFILLIFIQQVPFLKFFVMFHFILFYLFIFGCVEFLLRAGFLLVAVSRGCSLLRYVDFSLRWLLLLRSMGSRCAGFSSCGTWAQ